MQLGEVGIKVYRQSEEDHCCINLDSLGHSSCHDGHGMHETTAEEFTSAVSESGPLVGSNFLACL